MVERKPVIIAWQIAFMFFPFVWIYAFYRIEKLRMGIILMIITIFPFTGIQMLFPFPYGMIMAIVIVIATPIYFVIRWSNEWNQKIR